MDVYKRDILNTGKGKVESPQITNRLFSESLLVGRLEL